MAKVSLSDTSAPSWPITLIGTLVVSVCVNFVQNSWARDTTQIDKKADKEWVIEYVSANTKPIIVEVQSIKENVTENKEMTSKIYEIVLKISMEKK